MGTWKICKFKEINSTNTALKAMTDAPHGTVFVASRQTAGRGRRGRSFCSPHGIYLSVLLRRQEAPEALLHLTAMTAVAIRRAISEVSGLDAEIKWVNDLLLNGKKICGILVEGCGDGRYVIGIGLNCNTDPEELAPEIRDIAGCFSCDEDTLIEAVVRNLQDMDAHLMDGRSAWIREYTEHCMTVGKPVLLVRADCRQEAFAEGIDENGALLVRYADGKTAAVCSGEASVRGLDGYF